MSAASPDDTQRMRRLTRDYAASRVQTRAACASLSGVVPALRVVVRDAKEDLRRRLDAERTRGLTRSVLVVDDHSESLDVMVASLEIALGVPVYGARDCDEAMLLWSAHKPCAVVADLCLGNERGDTFINQLPHGVRAVLLSGVADLLTLYTAAARCQATPLSRADVGSLPAIVRGMIDAVHPPLWCRADGNRFLDVSDDLAALLGRTRREMVGVGWRDIVHPDDIAPSEAEQCRRAGMGVEGFRQRMRRADGSYVTLAWDVTPMTDGVLYAVARVVG